MSVTGSFARYLFLLTVRRTVTVCGAVCMALVCSGHVTSPDTYFEGKAGPYPVRVSISGLSEIPARTDVVVRTLGPRATKVTATARVWNGGDKGAPPPLALDRVSEDSTLWEIPLWIMRQGSYAVLVAVDGAAGSGTVVVPYTAVANYVLPMSKLAGGGLAASLLFLAVGLVTIVGTTGEATLERGLIVDESLKRQAWRMRGVAVAVLVAAFLGGGAWWAAEARAYTAALYRPLPAAVTTRIEGASRVLRIAIDSAEARRRNWAPLVPDHSKLMHVFLIKIGDFNALAHLHPVAKDSLTFEASIPSLPAGKYYVFADIVHESGFAETLVQSIDFDAPVGQWTKSDEDDAYYLGGGMGTPFRFEDGSTLSWDGAAAPHVTFADAGLTFTLRDAKGTPLTVEPYLGMAGHAVVISEDGTVHVHLHPTGTASMAAQDALVAWTPDDTARGAVRAKLAKGGGMMDMPGMDMGATTHSPLPGVLNFPYAFPKAGTYRVWVQFRHGGAVRTAAFDVVTKYVSARIMQ